VGDLVAVLIDFGPSIAIDTVAPVEITQALVQTPRALVGHFDSQADLAVASISDHRLGGGDHARADSLRLHLRRPDADLAQFRCLGYVCPDFCFVGAEPSQVQMADGFGPCERDQERRVAIVGQQWQSNMFCESRIPRRR